MTTGPASKYDFYIPPVPAGTPRPKNPNDKYILAFFAVHICIMLILHPFSLPSGIGPGSFFDKSRAVHYKFVSATVQQPDPTRIVATYQGGPDEGSLTALTVTVLSRGEQQIKTAGSENSTVPVAPGTELVFDGLYEGKDSVAVIGRFSDGTEQALLYATV
jgi:hypothetical protein